MQIASIKGRDVFLVYHPAEHDIQVGSQFIIEDCDGAKEGILVQILRNESLEYAGLQQELIQQILEDRFGDDLEVPIDRERGMSEIRRLKIAQAKIRMRFSTTPSGTPFYFPWDGWIPSRNAVLKPVSIGQLLQQILTHHHKEFCFCDIEGEEVPIAGPSLDMINVITGVKGSGKSHFAKLLLASISGSGVPCLVFDVNREYTPLEGVIQNLHVYEWGRSYRPNLLDVGMEFLLSVQEGVYPLSTDTMKAEYEHHIDRFLQARRAYLRKTGQPEFVSLDEVITEIDRLDRDGTIHSLVAQGIIRRLRALFKAHLFANNLSEAIDFATLYESIAEYGGVIVFDMHNLELRMRRSLVRSILKALEDICDAEANPCNGKERPRGAFPFVFFEEAHQYVEESDIVNIITRGRHIGIAPVFITNTPDKLPEIVFRQLDNLFLLSLTHQSDIKHVAKSSLTDEDTIVSFATRMPLHHAMIIGKVTKNYPLVVRVHDFPADWPKSGKTRSPWERFEYQQKLDEV